MNTQTNERDSSTNLLLNGSLLSYSVSPPSLSIVVLEVKIVSQLATHARLKILVRNKTKPCTLSTCNECFDNKNIVKRALSMGWGEKIASVFFSSALLTEEQEESDDEDDSENERVSKQLVRRRSSDFREQEKFLCAENRSQSISSTFGYSSRNSGVTSIFGPRRRSSIAMTR